MVAATETEMEQLGILMGRAFPSKGYACFVFEFGEDGDISYISNTALEDIIANMQVFLREAEKEIEKRKQPALLTRLN